MLNFIFIFVLLLSYCSTSTFAASKRDSSDEECIIIGGEMGVGDLSDLFSRSLRHYPDFREGSSSSQQKLYLEENEMAPEVDRQGMVAPIPLALVNLMPLDVISHFDDLFPIVKRYNLNDIALVLDFDDTVSVPVFSSSTGEKFDLVGSADCLRSYEEEYKLALSPLGYSIDTLLFLLNQRWSFLGHNQYYDVLDPSLRPVLDECREFLGYLTILSGHPTHPEKSHFLKELGIVNYLSPRDHRHLGIRNTMIGQDGQITYTSIDKADTLAMNLPKTIKVVIFVDNSIKYAINPFREQIEAALKKRFSPAEEGQEVIVHTVHYTYFEDKLRHDEGAELKRQIKRIFEIVKK